MIGFLIVIAFILLTLVILMFLMLAFDLFLDLPYVATDRKKIDIIIKLARIKKGETVIDLGSGDGRLLFAAAKKGAKAIGYELNPFLIAITLVRARIKGLRHQVCLERRNLWSADLKVADVIFVYAFKKSMQKFEDFIFQNAKAGTRVVVNTNPFPNKKPQKVGNNIFLYQV